MTEFKIKMKTVFFSITHGFQARDLLHTDVLQVLKDHGVRIVILAPNHNDPKFVQQFQDEQVFIEPLITKHYQLEEMSSLIRRFLLANYKLNRTVHLLNEEFRRSNKIRHRFFQVANAVFGRMKSARDIWLFFESIFFADRDHGSVFEKYTPDLLVTGTPGYIFADAHLLRRAKRMGVPSACVVLSWDNLTSKGHMGARPDHLIVWNQIMQREAIDLHDYDLKRVHIAGVSHFDIYADRFRLKSREEFCREMGLDPARKIITIGTVTPLVFPHNAEIIEILAQANLADRFIEPAQILVRLHPQVMNAGTIHAENIERFRELAQEYDNVILDLPAVRSSSLMWDIAKADMQHLAEIMLHSDVTLNAVSTLTIDSAIFDTPIIGIGFDGHERKLPSESIIRCYDYTHYANIVLTGGLRIAHNADEMINSINAYLADPALDREGRQRIVKEQCFKIDGQSGQRVAHLLLEQMGLMSKAEYSLTSISNTAVSS